MYAVIATGGKQYRVAEGQTIKVEKLAADAGDNVEFDQVLLIADGDSVNIGTPFIEGGKVVAKVAGNGRGKKVEIIKFKRRKHHRKRMGHRQDYTEIEITGIGVGKVSAKKSAPAEKKEAAPIDTSADDAPLFTGGPAGGKADDLKRISGVGPVLEGKLNALGIYNFSQIAEFSAEDIQRVDDRLNFKGRIEREDWISQARDLASGDEEE